MVRLNVTALRVKNFPWCNSSRRIRYPNVRRGDGLKGYIYVYVHISIHMQGRLIHMCNRWIYIYIDVYVLYTVIQMEERSRSTHAKVD